MGEPVQEWSESDLENQGKKAIVDFVQKNGSEDFLRKHKLKGKLASVAKNNGKPKIVAAYLDLFKEKAFRTSEDDVKAEADAAAKLEKLRLKKEAEKSKEESIKDDKSSTEKEVPKFKKLVLTKGDKLNFPRKGDTVSVRFKGTIKSTGKVFQSCLGKKDKPLQFKVGVGKVIRGWDEALLTMSVGEKCEVTIEPEWAYGAKGKEGIIPPNATLVFEMELLKIM